MRLMWSVTLKQTHKKQNTMHLEVCSSRCIMEIFLTFSIIKCDESLLQNLLYVMFLCKCSFHVVSSIRFIYCS